MNKKTMISLFFITIIIASLIFYYAGRISDPQATLDYYKAKKEDLSASQQRIEQLLLELNQSINVEMQKQDTLTSKITELSAKADVPPPTINKTVTVQDPPVYVPVPLPVTSAS